MAKKTFTIIKHRNERETETSGTIDELLKHFSYTLECGKSWEHEDGNKKINDNPKSGKSLVSNLNNAINNSAANGYCQDSYVLKE